jgi:hypothetical protein
MSPSKKLTVSHVGIFDLALWTVAPLPFLSGSTLPPPPSLCWISIQYTSIKCVRGGVLGTGPRTGKHLPWSPFTGQFLYMTACCIAFYESYLSSEGCNHYGDLSWSEVIAVHMAGQYRLTSHKRSLRFDPELRMLHCEHSTLSCFHIKHS